MPFFRNQRQYQQLAFVAVVVAAPVVTAVYNVTSSSQVVFKDRFQYQSHTEPAFVPPPVVPVDSWFRPLNQPVRLKIGLRAGLQQSFTAPPAVITPNNPILDGITSAFSSQVIFKKWMIYESEAKPVAPPERVTVDKWIYRLNEPVRLRIGLSTGDQQFIAQGQVFAPEVVTEDKWHFPWSEPVRQKIGLKAYLQQAFIAPVLNPESQITQNFESRWHQPWSEPVRFRRFPTSEQQTLIQGAVQVQEIITVDKWIYPWTEPVRQKIGLKTHLQQALISPVLNPETQIIQDFESRWHYPWSEPVRFRRFPTAEQQTLAFQPPSFEVITIDKWGYPWSEPVRQKPGLKTHLQQTSIQTVLNPDTQISQDFESRWHYPWSEPVRIKRQVPVGEQQFLIQGPVQTPEFITVDKWIYAWSEPVRQKIGLKTHLQQALIAPVLNPETQIIQDIESRWHYAWSEPVRFRIFPTAEQTFIAAPATSVFETLTVDKWIYAWSEPVRQKPGLKTHLQQAFIGTTLNPETQIIQGYESRWHFAWSEPVRVKRQVPVGEQSFLIQGPVKTPEFITVDKWIYAWSEPVRQKIGIQARLQQALIAPVLADDQITGSIESRWHYAWSEPVRFRRLPVSEQPTVAQPIFTPEFVPVDKWGYAWSEPVREKIGLKAHQQQALIAPVLNPETQITQDIEARWHYPWSEPVRFRVLATVQQPFVAEPTTSVFEIITVDKWIYRLEEPVRLKIDPRRAIALAAPAAIGPVLNPETQLIQGFESRWHYPWSEPKRFKLGLGAWLQQFTTPQTPIFPTGVVRTMNWFAPFNEPVRLKIGLMTGLQRFFQTSQEQILPDVFVTLSATEVNADSAVFGITVYNQVAPVLAITPRTVVSITEIPAVRDADISIEEV